MCEDASPEKGKSFRKPTDEEWTQDWEGRGALLPGSAMKQAILEGVTDGGGKAWRLPGGTITFHLPSNFGEQEPSSE